MRRRDFLATTAAVLSAPVVTFASAAERRLLYIAQPGIRNYVQYGGVGILVYDVDAGYRFVKRIPTWAVPDGQQPENVKGVVASAATGRIYVSTIRRLCCIDLVTEQMLWDVTPAGGCDRHTISPDGMLIYAPSFEGPNWNVIDAMTGETIATIMLHSRAHNTLFSIDGAEVYLAGLTSPMLSVADPRTHTVVRTVGPFAHSIRPFTVNGSRTLVYVNVNQLLGFEIGDLRTGQKIARVEVQGYKQGPVARHGCPSHGVGLTPDEREVWVCDGHNSAVHIFDNTVMPPKQIDTVKVRDQPGWISFSMDGRHAYPSTGEIFDTRTRQRVVALDDEVGRQIGSEKQLEVVMDGQNVVRVSDQFGIGQKR